MRRCPWCDRVVWPWQDTRPDWSFQRGHVTCYERFWDEYFALTPPAVVASSRLAYEVMLMAPKRWTDALSAEILAKETA